MGKQMTRRPREPIELTTRKRTHTAPTSQQTRPTKPLTTSTVGPLNYGNKPKISTAKRGLSVNAKPTQQSGTNPA